MKKFAKIITAAALVMALMVPVFASAEGGRHGEYLNKTYTVNTTTHQNLNLRCDCNTKDKWNIITVVPYGADVNVLEFIDNGAWAIVQYKGHTGYVAANCLAEKAPVQK